MKPIKLAIILSIFLLLFNVRAYCQSVSFVIEKNDDAITVPVMIDGKGPFNFILDTAGRTFISDDVLEALSLKKGKDAIATSTHNTISGKGSFLIFPVHNIKIQNTDIEQSLHIISKPVVSSKNAVAKSLDKWDGILGADFLENSRVNYSANNSKFTIQIISNKKRCELEETPEQCLQKEWYQPKVKAQVGGEQSEIIVDTGLTGTEKIIMYKSEFTNTLWKKHHNPEFDVKIPLVSDFDLLSLIGDGLFLHKNKRCIAQFFIRNPDDRTKLHQKTTGIIGWNALKAMDFEINFAKRTTKISKSSCPNAGYNRAGIIGYIISDDFKTLNVQILDEGSPAMLTGIKKGDIIRKITVADTGQEFETFNAGFHQNTFFLPSKTRLILDIKRDEKLIKKCITLNDYQAVGLSKTK